MKPLVSVVVPAYNCEKTIEKCLNSILCCKTKESLEEDDQFRIQVIVVDDCSIDNTAKIVDSIQEIDRRVHVIHHTKNLGPGGARETALQHADGDYFCFCDSDDWVYPDWILCFYRNIIQYDADIACCRSEIDGIAAEYHPGVVEVWEKKEAIKTYLEHKRLNGSFPIKMIKRQLLENIHFDSSRWYWEDDDLMWQMLQKVSRVVREDNGLYHICVHSDSLCGKKQSEQRVRDTFTLWDKIFKDVAGSEYADIAYKTGCSFYFNDLKLMYRDGIRYAEIEEQYVKFFRSHISIFLSSLSSAINRVFGCLVLLSPALARRIIQIKA